MPSPPAWRTSRRPDRKSPPTSAGSSTPSRSRTETIAAPWVALMPRSLIMPRDEPSADIGTQHAEIADARGGKTRLGGQPITVFRHPVTRHVSANDHPAASARPVRPRDDEENLRPRSTALNCASRHRRSRVRRSAARRRRRDSRRWKAAPAPSRAAGRTNGPRKTWSGESISTEAEQADVQAVPDIQRPGRPPPSTPPVAGNHDRAADHGPAHAGPLGDAAHEQAAETGAHPH